MSEFIKLSFTGDIMCDNLNNMKTHYFDGFISDGLKKVLSSCDYLVGNLETPILNNISTAPQRYSFCAPIDFIKNLKKYNFKMFSTANNHTLDCGFNGIVETIDNLDKIGLDHVGTYKSLSDYKQKCIKTFDGMKIGFLSYTYGTNAFLNNNYVSNENKFMINLLKKQERQMDFFYKLKNKFIENVYFFHPIRDKKYLTEIKEKISELKSNCDFVIFLLHSGGQYNKKVDHYTKKLCDFLVNNGVDLIVGNHPHVVLNHKNNNIFYSLGNFYATPYSNHNQTNDLPNYSILLNCYFDINEKKLCKVSYDIVKTVVENGYPITKLTSEVDSSSVNNEVMKIVKAFGDNYYSQGEKTIWERK